MTQDVNCYAHLQDLHCMLVKQCTFASAGDWQAMLGGISPVMKAAATPFRASSAVRALAYVAIFMPTVPVYISMS